MLTAFPLLADAELFDELKVAFGVGLVEVVQQRTAFADEDEQGTAGTGVLFVGLEVGGEVLDPLGEKGDLDFGGTGVLGVFAIPFDDIGGLFLG